MAVGNFIPELWDAQIKVGLQAAHNIVQSGLVNRDYEGQLRQQGDSVRVFNLNDVAINEYNVVKAGDKADGTTTTTPNRTSNSLSYAEVTGSYRTIIAEKGASWSIKVHDLDETQSALPFRASATSNAARGLANKADDWAAAQMLGAATAVVLDNADVAAAADYSAKGDIVIDALLALKVKLDTNNVPAADRSAVLTPALAAALVRHPLFLRDDQRGDTAGRLNGSVGQVFGFNILSVNTGVTSNPDTGVDSILAVHPMGFSYVEQLTETEAFRSVEDFSDKIRGLLVYGGGVIEPLALVKADLTVRTVDAG